MTLPGRGHEEVIRGFLVIPVMHFIHMTINDYVCSSFRTCALHKAKLIFYSPLHLLCRANNILQPYFTVSISANSAWLKRQSTTEQFQLHF